MWFNAASQMQERSIELQLHNCEEVDITPSKRTTLWNHTVGVLQMIYYRCYYVHHTLESVHHTLSLSLSLIARALSSPPVAHLQSL